MSARRFIRDQGGVLFTWDQLASGRRDARTGRALQVWSTRLGPLGVSLEVTGVQEFQCNWTFKTRRAVTLRMTLAEAQDYVERELINEARSLARRIGWVEPLVSTVTDI